LLVDSHSASLAAAGVDPSAKVHDFTFALNGYSAIMSDADAKAVKMQKGVVLVLEDQMRYADTDSSPKFLGLTVSGGAYDTGFTGEGVVVGIIDSGIWPEHPSFADDGTFPAPPTGPLPCEFGNTAHNPADAPFTCNNKLIGADQVLDTYRALIGAEPFEFDSARDDNGHGTHTASTAAGNAGVDAVMYGLPVATISGIAPRAHVVAYKGLGTLGGFTSDLAAAIDRAVADGVDVINYSIGGGAGAPGADEIAFLFAANAGVFVATSAGNSGPGDATLGNPGTMPWMTTVGASTQKRFFGGIIKLGNYQVFTGASLTDELVGWQELVDAEFAGGDLCIVGTLDPTVVAGKVVLCRRGANARADKSLAVFQAGGVGMIMYENTDDNSLFTDSHWVPSVHVDNTPGLAIKAYIASDPNPVVRIDTRNNGLPRVAGWPYAPSMTYFSSRGPNPVAPDLIKPDVTAPGIQILAGYSPMSDGGIPGEMFAAIAGTSMSSPHVAGVFALLKQAHPEWSAAAAKSALMTTAY
jgi:subtilisin family serine protease